MLTKDQVRNILDNCPADSDKWIKAMQSIVVGLAESVEELKAQLDLTTTKGKQVAVGAAQLAKDVKGIQAIFAALRTRGGNGAAAAAAQPAAQPVVAIEAPTTEEEAAAAQAPPQQAVGGVSRFNLDGSARSEEEMAREMAMEEAVQAEEAEKKRSGGRA